MQHSDNRIIILLLVEEEDGESRHSYWQGAPEEHTWLYSDACNIPRLDAAQWGAYNLDGPVILVNVTGNAKFVAMTERDYLQGNDSNRNQASNVSSRSCVKGQLIIYCCDKLI